MNNAPAAFKATFSDFRLVRSRKQAQFVFEVPIEAADAALSALGGLPSSVDERWVGVARITDEAAQRSSETPQIAMEQDKATRPFHTLPLAQQAALRCRDTLFCQFMKVATPEQAAIRVREECGVKSRGEIESDPTAAARWHAILQDYDRYQRGFR